jgi:hypothetical protein
MDVIGVTNTGSGLSVGSRPSAPIRLESLEGS